VAVGNAVVHAFGGRDDRARRLRSADHWGADRRASRFRRPGDAARIAIPTRVLEGRVGLSEAVSNGPWERARRTDAYDSEAPATENS
jgi:hypothetical protein